MASTLVTSLAQAIARQENANPAYNNPGNLQPRGFTYAGQTGTAANGDAIFATPQDGWNALYNQVQLNINRGLTLNEFFAGSPGIYAGYASAGAGNDPYTYAANVSSWTGIDPNTPLNQISSGSGAIASNSIPGASTQPIIDLSGVTSSTSTSDILSSLENALGVPADSVGSPVADAMLLAAAAGAAWLVMQAV